MRRWNSVRVARWSLFRPIWAWRSIWYSIAANPNEARFFQEGEFGREVVYACVECNPEAAVRLAGISSRRP